MISLWQLPGHVYPSGEPVLFQVRLVTRDGLALGWFLGDGPAIRGRLHTRLLKGWELVARWEA